MYIHMYVRTSVSNLQTVFQPVRIGEHAIIHLSMPTVTVPVGTRETTARPEVTTAHNLEHLKVRK